MGICSSTDATNSADSEEVYEVLSQTIFSIIGDDAMLNMSTFFKRADLEEGRILFKEGEEASHFFLMYDGEIELKAGGQVIAVKHKGQYFGPDTVNDDKQIATATCKTQCTIFYLDEDDYKSFLEGNSNLMDQVESLMGYNIDTLAKIEIFAGVDRRKLSLLNAILTPRVVKEGEVLFTEGDNGTSMFIVADGQLSTRRKAPAVTETKSSLTDKKDDVKADVLFGPGSFFGEMGLIMKTPRSVTIVATQTSVVLELKQDVLDKFLSLMPANTRELLMDSMKRRTAEFFRDCNIPFFTSIPKDKFGLLAKLSEVRHLDAGVEVVKEGDDATEFFIIAHGTLKVYSKGNFLCDKSNGSYFGEIALVMDSKRTATVTTASPCVLLSISKTNFSKFVQEVPQTSADFEVKLGRYAVQLRSVIYHPIGLYYFHEFLQKEHSDENIEFWMKVRDYRHTSYADVTTKRESADRRSSINLEDLPVAGGDSSQAKGHVTAAFKLFRRAKPQENSIGKAEFTQLLTLFGIWAEEEAIDHALFSLGWKQDADTITEEMFVNALQNGQNETARRQSHQFPAMLLWKLNRAIQRSELTKIRTLFEEVDKTKSGKLTLDDFAELMKRLAPELSYAALAEKFGEMDEKKTGTITQVDLVRYFISERVNKARLQRRLEQRAKEIYDIYISNKAPRQVNLKSENLNDVTQRMEAKNIDIHLFDKSEQEVLKLMESDSFRRFKESALFKDFLDKVDSYSHLEDAKAKVLASTQRVGLSARVSVAPEPVMIGDVIARASAAAPSPLEVVHDEEEEDDESDEETTPTPAAPAAVAAIQTSDIVVSAQ